MPNKSFRRLRVFLCHANLDKSAVREFYQKLVMDGFEVWLDTESLVPGQDWRVEIPKAIRTADVVIVFLSKASISREGYVQKEIKFALDVADEKPEHTIYIIPAKLEECQVPERLEQWQWVELFKENGYSRLFDGLRKRSNDPNLKSIITPRLSIQAFGFSQVRVYGKIITPSQWQTQSVRELFFYFFTEARPMSKEEVGNIMWPDIYDFSRLKLRFANDLQRLRTAVGKDTIIFENNLYRFNQNLDYEYDVGTFIALIEKAKLASDTNTKVALLQSAVDLVDGPYLYDIYSDWVIYKREELNQVHLATLIKLANLLFNNQEKERALKICQRAINADSCFEEAHQLIMKIYYELGDRVSVVRQYRTCKENLMKQFNLPPSSETEALFRTLVGDFGNL